jgi:hypothetical protein
MNKTELLALITTAGWTILTDTQQNTEGSLTNWQVVGVKATGDILKRKKFFYCVLDSTAYWRDTDQLVSPSTFLEDVNDYIAGLITAETIEGAIVTSIDIDKDIATATFYEESGSDVITTPMFIDKNSSEEIQHREIK